ncbi:thiol peroxidase [Desulforamulus profundi]|uniref:thiol peroxidase n=1 Tax=Desulforamulus profundi TaxID=1383067 RepID=UPI002368C7AD|nr:thiol peroxidase [Desulforamulus profundi]
MDIQVCNLQTSRFNHEAAWLNGVQILTLSVDLPFALGRYCAAQRIDKVKTLSDHKDLSFGLAYVFVIKELRLLSRGIVVLDQNNTVQYVEYVKEITKEADYDSALAAVKKLV